MHWHSSRPTNSTLLIALVGSYFVFGLYKSAFLDSKNGTIPFGSEM